MLVILMYLLVQNSFYRTISSKINNVKQMVKGGLIRRKDSNRFAPFFPILHGDPISAYVYACTEHNACPGYVVAINNRKRMLTARLGYLLTG